MADDEVLNRTSPARLAVSVVLRSEGRFLLVERAHDPGRGMFAFPGGRVEEGEQLDEAARRELLEETGLEAGELVEIAQYDLGSARGGFYLHVFSAAVFDGVVNANDDALSAGWYTLQEMSVMPVPQSVLEVASTLSDSELS